jgi:hypothetical protein
MPRLTSLNILLIPEIKDLYDAEMQLSKALPEMAKAANDPALKGPSSSLRRGQYSRREVGEGRTTVGDYKKPDPSGSSNHPYRSK